MSQLDPQIAQVVRELRDKLEQGKAARIPWSLYEDVIASRGLKPETFEHSGHFHAEVVAGIGVYDEVVADYVGENETSFGRFCKDTGLNSKFQRPLPPHW